MEPAAKKPKISQEKCLDPFTNALFEDMLQDLTFHHLSGKEIKLICEVSTLWDDIASASKKCGDKLKLRIDDKGDSIHDKLQIIAKNKRKYGTLWLSWNQKKSMILQDAQSTSLMQEIMNGLGSSLRKLSFNVTLKTTDVALLLTPLHNLEFLDLPPQMIDNVSVTLSPLLLPKLRVLKLHNPGNLWLDLLSNVSTLEEFEMYSYEEFMNFQNFENFILRQEKLKKLDIRCEYESEREHQIFSDLSRVKFRLESVGIYGISIDKGSAAEFFKFQQNLKEVGFEHFNEPNRAEYREILRSICTLSKLERFDFGEEGISDEDLVALGNIGNESVKHIKPWENEMAAVHGRIFEIFPNLESYEESSENLELLNIPSEKLVTLKTLNEVLVYRPPMVAALADFNQEKFESEVTELLRRSKRIISLDIGRDEWIQQGMQLSVNFWKNVIEILLKLETIVIYNSDDIEELVQALIDCERNFISVEIRIDAVGQASVEEMEMPSWLEINIIE